MSNLNYKDWAKQFYLSTKNYTDTVSIAQSKEVWNRILDLYPRLAEFWTGTHELRELTTIERSFIEYIIQSELQKPYENPYYPEMEYTWPNWEFPYPECDDLIEDCDPSKPPIEEHIFDAESDSCWCPGVGANRPFVITGTHPIYLLTITEKDCATGTGLAIHGGWGTNRLYGEITACGSEEGFITIEASMNAYDGTPGDSNVNLFECDDCCPEMSCDYDLTPATVGRSGNATMYWQGGSPDYQVNISGTGFWLDSGFTITQKTVSTKYITIYTDGTACGTGTIQVQSVNPECSAIPHIYCSIKNTFGSWSYANAGCAGQIGGTPENDCCGTAEWVGAILKYANDSDTCVQWSQYTNVGCGSCSNIGGCGCNDPANFPCAAITPCLVPPEGWIILCSGFTDHVIWSDPATTSGKCDNAISGIVACWLDCATPQAGKSQGTRCFCNGASYPSYDKWVC